MLAHYSFNIEVFVLVCHFCFYQQAHMIYLHSSPAGNHYPPSILWHLSGHPARQQRSGS